MIEADTDVWVPSKSVIEVWLETSTTADMYVYQGTSRINATSAI